MSLLQDLQELARGKGMSESVSQKSLIFQVKDFEAQLRVLAPEFRESGRTLFQALGRSEFLRQHETFLNATGPLVVSGVQVVPRGNSSAAYDLVSLAIPFTDRNTGICLRFALNFTANGSNSVSVSLERRGGMVMENVLDLWDFSERNQFGLARQDSLIGPAETLESGIDRILAMADQFLLEHCEAIVSGEVWPEGFTELIQTADIDEFLRNAGLPGNLNIVDHQGRTLLCHAVLAGDANRLKALLTLGADPNSTHAAGVCLQPSDERGCAALHHLTKAIHLDTAVAVQMADLLKQHGANFDQPSGDGSTPLGLASRMVWTDLVRHLLQLGARRLGTHWCDTWTTPGTPVSIEVRILDQMLRSALGQASMLADR